MLGAGIRRSGAGSAWGWGLGAVVIVLAGGAIPLAFDPGFYWRGDTQLAYFGALYHLGGELQAGRIPLLEPTSWQGGALAVEGYWALFNPLIWLLALGATVVSNAAGYMTALKLGVLAISAAGSFLLARTYRVPDPVAFLVAVLVPLGGFTTYLDVSSWYLGALVGGLLPWAWWGLRRTALANANPFPALLAGYLLVTVGYVFGTAMLAVAIAATMLDAWRAGRRVGTLKTFGIGVCTGLAALATHLPFMLSSEVTVRGTWAVGNSGIGIAELSRLATAQLPVSGYQPPIFYIAWLLPMVAFVDFRRFWASARDLTGLLVVATVAWLWLLGPSDIGPIRWPVRLMPYVGLTFLILGAVALHRARTEWSPRRLLVAVGLVAFSTYLTITAQPPNWRVQLLIGALVAVGLVLV